MEEIGEGAVFTPCVFCQRRPTAKRRRWVLLERNGALGCAHLSCAVKWAAIMARVVVGLAEG